MFLTPHRNIATESKERLNFISLGRYPDLQTLNIAYVQKSGYTNLRYTITAVCLTPIASFQSPPSEYCNLEVAMPEAWKELFPSAPIPKNLAAPCCAECRVRGLEGTSEEKRVGRVWEVSGVAKQDRFR